MSDAVVIPLSKGKLVLLTLGAIGFVVASVWIWTIAPIQPRFDPTFARIVAVAGVVFFGLCGAWGAVKLFDGRPGLVIDEEGIIDRSSAVSAGRIPWSEIVGLEVSSIFGQRILTVLVAHPEAIMARQSAFVRLLSAGNTKLMRSPINLASNALRIDFDELVRVLTRAFEEHRHVRT